MSVEDAKRIFQNEEYSSAVDQGLFLFEYTLRLVQYLSFTPELHF